MERNIIKATFPIPFYSFIHIASPYVTCTVLFFTVLFYSAVVEFTSDLSQPYHSEVDLCSGKRQGWLFKISFKIRPRIWPIYYYFLKVLFLQLMNSWKEKLRTKRLNRYEWNIKRAMTFIHHTRH